MISQEELITMCKRGDATGYTGLYNLHAAAVYNTVVRLVVHTAEAEDVLQDSFVAAFGGIAGLKNATGFRPWVKRIAINKSIDLIRKRKLHFVEFDPALTAKQEDETVDEVEFEYTMDGVSAAIAALPNGYRTVFNLFAVENMPHADIAELLGLEQNTVRTQYHRAKNRILNTLKQGGYCER